MKGGWGIPDAPAPRGALGRGRLGTQLASVWLAAVLFFGLAIAPLLAGAQTRATLPRIGILSFEGAPSATSPDPAQGFARGLRELGYVEGQNIVVERRYADGRPERLAALATELVQLKVDVILTGGPGPRDAARQATNSIPIVTVSGADPVAEGWAQSLARPGGNVTGLTVTFPELNAKRFELLKQAFPGLVRVALLVEHAAIGDAKAFVQAMEASIRPLGLQIQPIEVRGPDDIDAAFGLARREHAQAVYVIATNIMVGHRAKLATLAIADKLLSISEFPLMAQAGFLVTYGADLDDLTRRAAMMVDKILKGARPGDLAVERPTKLQLIVNLKTAKALGVTIPQSLLLRADEVIE